ncbi:helix-turn-helix domain-containing protein [Falsiroseomonas sp.]|uniref:helix-turn-helix domain-containing protein n=1 Tax=Falsiroseomonas sp. TaxID=2870721 RepID=UPI003566ACDA
MDDIARRLRAVRAELGLTKPQMAEALSVGRGAYYVWEQGSSAKKPNFPAEEAMVELCEQLPGLTLDYVYRGRLQTLPIMLGVRLLAREAGKDPDEPGFDHTEARQAWGASIAEQVDGAERRSAIAGLIRA